MGNPVSAGYQVARLATLDGGRVFDTGVVFVSMKWSKCLKTILLLADIRSGFGPGSTRPSFAIRIADIRRMKRMFSAWDPFSQ